MARKAQYAQIISILTVAIGMGGGLAWLRPSPKPHAVTHPAPNPATSASQTHTNDSVNSPTVIETLVIAPQATIKTRPDGAAKSPAAPAFVERAAGVYEASTSYYTALLSASEGLRYLPQKSGTFNRRSDNTPPTSELRLRLKSITRGATALFDRAADATDDNEVAVAKGSGGMSYWHGQSIEECYEPRGNGIEQTFIFDTLPAGDGNLDFALDIQTKDLVPLPPRASHTGGILFADKSGSVAVRYGQVMARDAAGHFVAAEPLCNIAENIVTFSIPKAWIDAAKFPVVIDPLVGQDFAVNNPTNATPSIVSQPTVCAGVNNFLVAWIDYTNGTSAPLVAGSIVSATGTASAPFAISNTTGFPVAWRFQRIEAAFDGANWLVAWSDGRSNGPGIRGAIVGAGGVVLNGSDFLIAATATGLVTEDPLVSYDGANYVVAWTDTPPGLSGGSSVYFTQVSSAGVSNAAQVLPALTNPPNQSLEYLASQRPSGDSLIIYREIYQTPVQHLAIRIAQGGVRKDTSGITLFNENQYEHGFGRPIGVVFNNNEWQILSSYDQTVNSHIFLNHLSTVGVVTPPTGVFATFGVGPTGITSSGVYLDAFAPAFAGANEWLFLRNERVNSNTYHLIGKRVTFSGTDLDPGFFQIDTATRGIIRSSVAAQAGGSFLAAWVDGRNGSPQPADAVNIAASLIDATVADVGGAPIVPVIAASPTSGGAPLTVAFDSTQSTTGYDTLAWDFGDGTTSTLVSPSHTYKSNGTYIARLALTKGAYIVYDSVIITVGSGGFGETPTQLGMPLDNTPPIVTGLFISTVTAKLDFVNLNNDQIVVAGFFDVTSLSQSNTGLLASVTVGGYTQAFNLDAKGSYVSPSGNTPVINFILSSTTGAFVYTVANASIRSQFAGIGATNSTITPPMILPLPITVTVDKLNATASVGVAYHSTVNINGVANYGFLGVGNEISGSFLITTFSATQAGTTGHTFAIKGRLVRPGAYKPGATGSYTIALGQYSTSIPVGFIINNNGVFTFKATKLKSGVKMFMISPGTGVFSLQLVNIPSAQANGGTGLPLAKSTQPITKVDLNLSFQFDLQNNERLTAGRYIYIGRPNANSGTWKLR